MASCNIYINYVRFFIYKIPNIFRIIKCPFYLILNRFLFWLLNIKYGSNLKVYNNIYLSIEPQAQISIGNNFIFTSGDAINPLCKNLRGCIHAVKGSRIKIGNNVGISSACIWAKESITIEDNVKIGADSVILDTDCHNLDYRIRCLNDTNEDGISIDSISAQSKPIVIKNDVLIGAKCIILKGVTIGARSIIGSGSVVTKSIPDDCIAAGNPCKIIKYINESKE